MLLKRVSVRRKRLNALFFSEPFEMENAEFSKDGGLLVNCDAFDEWGFSENDEVSYDDVEQLVKASAYKRACSRALWLLNARDYTRKGLVDKLKLKFGEEAAQAAADKMQQLNFIDDERFAERYAEQLLTVQNVSLRETKSKLYQKGVPRELIDLAVERVEFSSADQLDDVVRKRYAYKLENADEDTVRKVVNALLRKGFAYSDIKAAIKRCCNQEMYD